MKKLIAVILSLCLAASLASCTKKDDENKTSSAASSHSEDVSSEQTSSEDEENPDGDTTDFTIDDDVETEEITVYTNSSKDVYWTPFEDSDYIVDYKTDKDDNVFFAQMDSAMQVLPVTSGDGVIVAVKNGGEKKKLKVTVIEGDDPENPPVEQDPGVVVETYDPSNLTIPSSYYYKIEEKYAGGMEYSYIMAKTKTEYSMWSQDGDDKTTETARYINSEIEKLYDWDYESGWVEQQYDRDDYKAELNNFESGLYFMGNAFVDHFYGFTDVMKYKVGEEKIQNIDCNIFEQKISDDHYYRYYVQPGTNVTLKMVECVPTYDGVHTWEMTSYVEYLTSIPTNINLKPSSL